ncbi:hypothetical protein INT45_006390 [Circinella minor]|uniref:DUF1838 domain-containing protein n=1 Tax=Circinella minor TaxID=1195481 RepID=A0A8H7SEH2_9FUNG|nr:hypothetical protein INT45_006390 [Circinella minor]
MSNLLLRLRYSSDPEADTFYEWEGSVFAFIPGEAPKKIFHCVGMNVGKADIKDNKIMATGRELTYYLDPKTHEKLSHWENPWTGEKLPVVHIANDPVQMALPTFIPLEIRKNPFSGTTKLLTEIPLFYPNPLANDPKFAPYDPNKMYQAGELFTFSCPTAQVEDEQENIDHAEVNWTRVSHFAPFMKMGDKQGYLVYHCTGHKLPKGKTYKDLVSPVLRNEIENRVPNYSHAPAAYNPEAKNVSSWTYFKEHFDRYENEPEAQWPPSIDN